ncbi:AAA family ATPase [Pseudomonas sp. UFMG81]|jgi:predicted ATP-binding protein involved in virulence|uniref:AAA family ATPase n=1 Tax=Pseudomonas sp. UFMG81 TaxID=2745936 RepID=UPI00188E0312|nr:AAA family ATPase [Pseudomonas sp. UFMG81]
MQIKEFQLQNFGRFEHLEASFMENEPTPAKVIVLVGNNGAGKTSILKALATSLSWFVGRVRSEKGTGSPIAEHAILNGAASAAIDILVTGTAAKEAPLRWTIARTRQGRTKQFQSDLSDATRLAEHYRALLTDANECSLPLVAYYPVERSVMEAPLRVRKRKAFDQVSGYEEFLNPAVGFAGFFEWFRDREDHENERVSEMVTVLITEGWTSQVFNHINDTSPLVVDVKPASLTLSEKLRHLTSTQRDRQLSAVRLAIEHFMPGFSNLRVQRKPRLQLMVDKDGQSLDILQLSQGEKSLMALVGDIARRLSLMNPALENPLHGSGVVLIDEVDMHLHPSWQRDVIRNLTHTFPNCQFILTTHSPLVISDYPDVLVLSLNDGQLEKVPSQFGQDANTVLLDVMDTHIRNPEVGSKLNDTLDAIQTGRLEEARQLIADLEKWLPPSNLELTRAKLFLRKQELRLEKDRQRR